LHLKQGAILRFIFASRVFFPSLLLRFQMVSVWLFSATIQPPSFFAFFGRQLQGRSFAACPEWTISKSKNPARPRLFAASSCRIQSNFQLLNGITEPETGRSAGQHPSPGHGIQALFDG
jgi:hypothetical protein